MLGPVEPASRPAARSTRAEPTRVGVIGCGRWGPNHVRVFQGLDGAQVVAVADRDAAQLARLAELHPAIPGTTDVAALLTDASVDAVVIATPPETHADLACRALQAGKDVLCEKPLCLTHAEARGLADLAESTGRVLMVGHVFLFNPGIVRVKEIVDRGDVGALYYLAATRTNLGIVQEHVNVAYDLATHDVAIFNWLVGLPPVTVSATGGAFLRSAIEEVVFVTLTYPGGIVAHVHASWLNPKKVRQMTVVGSRQMITWDDMVLATPVAVYNKGAAAEPRYGDYGEFLRISMWEGDVRLPDVAPEEPLKVQNRAFLDAVRTRRPVRSDARFAAGVVATLEAVAASLREGGAPVDVAADGGRA